MGRTEAIIFGLVTTLGAATGAGAAEGGAGGLEVRPEEVSNPAGGTPPTDSVEAISVVGAAPSFRLVRF